MTTTAGIPAAERKTSAKDSVRAALAAADRPVTVADLARATGVSRSSVAAALTTLETAGQAQRRRDDRVGGPTAPDRWAAVEPHAGPADTPAPVTTPDIAVNEAAALLTGTGTGDDAGPPAAEDAMPAPDSDSDPAPENGDGEPPAIDDAPPAWDTASGVVDAGTAASAGVEMPAAAGDGAETVADGETADGAAARGQEDEHPAADGDATAELAAQIVDAVRLVAACAQVCPSARCPLKPGRAARDRGRRVAEPRANSDGQPRMRPGELTRIVGGFLRDNAEVAFTAPEVARELARSSGAIGNALGNLVMSGEARLVTDKPRRYQAAVPASSRPTGTARPGQAMVPGTTTQSLVPSLPSKGLL
ncbi:MarR family transcriptional regulator [Frankia sp. CiP3]|uniref:MarR family transcriptional regulator n=1 Tax=Frankia sp. CiP3 TaxID=2880971 RepID=UPI001EF5EF6D|nr:MarR family transcriptional regulator [Frankia sp. CiP3]